MSKGSFISVVTDAKSDFILPVAYSEDKDTISISCVKGSDFSPDVPFSGPVVEIPKTFIPALIELLARISGEKS